jgi:hypothetical protein
VRRRLMARTSGFDTPEFDRCAGSDPLNDEWTESTDRSGLPLRPDGCIEFMGQSACMLFKYRVPGVARHIGTEGTKYSPYAKDNFQFERSIFGWRGSSLVDRRRKE